MFHRNGLILGFDGLFHRDHVHADAGASGRYHGGDLLQRQTTHPLEETTHFGIFLQDGVIHVGKFRTAGNEHGQDPLLGAGGILPVVLQNAHKGHIAQNLFQFFLALAGEFYHVGHGLGLSHTHLQSHLCLLVG